MLSAYAFYTTASEDPREVPDRQAGLDHPFRAYGIFRILPGAPEGEGGIPSDVLLTDRPLLAAVALWAVAVVIIIYTPGGAPGPLGR